MKSLPNSACLLLIIIFYSGFLHAQETTESGGIIRLVLKDGSELIGNIIEEDDLSVTIKTISELEIKVPKEQIVSRGKIDGQIKEGQFWYNDPNQTRMLFAPTAKGLKGGQGYFSVYEIFFPFVAVGVTDWLTLAGGMSLVPGAEKQIFYFAPKVTPLHINNLDISAGLLYISVPDEEKGVGISYGVASYGTENVSATFGMGYGFFGSDFADNPVFVLGGELRISRSLKLLTENWIIPASEANLLSIGIRFFGEKLAGDFGLLFSTQRGDGFPFIPWLGLVYNF